MPEHKFCLSLFRIQSLMYQSRSGSRRNAYVLNGVRSEGRIWLLHMEVLFVVVVVESTAGYI